MPNHIHLLAEMQNDPISRVMHGLLTAYSQYHNRKYGGAGLGPICSEQTLGSG